MSPRLSVSAVSLAARFRFADVLIRHSLPKFSVQRTPGQVREELEGLAGGHRVGRSVLVSGQDRWRGQDQPARESERVALYRLEGGREGWPRRECVLRRSAAGHQCGEAHSRRNRADKGAESEKFRAEQQQRIFCQQRIKPVELRRRENRSAGENSSSQLAGTRLGFI